MRWSAAIVFVGLHLSAEEPALLWTTRFDRNEGIDNPIGLQRDTTGNMYVIGSTRPTATQPADFVIIKYSATGTPIWTNFFDLDNRNDVAVSAAIDPAGVIFVTGESQFSWTNSAFVTVAFDLDGQRLWLRTNQPLPDLINRPAAIARDQEGNVLVAGTASTASAQRNFLTIKYDQTGETLWSQSYVGPRHADSAQTMKIDGAGNVYVLGTSHGGLETQRDFTLVKYRAAGTQLWVAHFDGPLSLDDYPADLAIDSRGNAIVVGYTEKGTPSADYVTLKYDQNGNELWARFFNGNLGGVGRMDQARYVAVGPDHSIYVTGLSEGPGGIGFVTIKYDADG